MAPLKLVSCPAQGDFYSIATMPDASTQPNRSEPSPSISTTDQPIEMDHDLTTQPQEVDITIEPPVSTDPAIIESDTATPQQPTEINVKITDDAQAVVSDSVAASQKQLPENNNEIPIATPSIDVEPDTTTLQQGSEAHNETSRFTISVPMNGSAPMDDSEIDQEGLEWSPTGFCDRLVTKWAREPDVEAIKQTVQYLQPGSTVTIEFLGQGAFNKVYTATIDGKDFAMKVVLPVDPWYKTESEVATMRFVRRVTKLPVPEVFAYQSTRDNPIRFEWILMEKMPGKPYSDVWTTIPWEAKEKMIRQIAQAQAELFKYEFKGIGNLYEPSWSCDPIPTPETQPSQVPSTKQDTLQALQYSTDGASDWPNGGHLKRSLNGVSRIVSVPFFWGDHLQQRIPRGPFHSVEDWFAARLAIVQNEFEAIVERLSVGELSRHDENDKLDSEDTLARMEKLRSLLPRLAQMQADSYPSVVFHDDLSHNNILIGKGGEMTGVVDWEFTSTVPSWKVCDYPEVLTLIEAPRLSKPDPAKYTGKDDDGPNEMYFDELREYERSILRNIFMAEMNRVAKPWVDLFNQGQVLRDFDLAITHCDDVMGLGGIHSWIEDLSNGTVNLKSLRERWWICAL